MKIRILNGGHAAIAYPGGLLDIHFVHEAMEHSLIRRYLEKLTKDEIIPEVPPVPDTNLEDYRILIDERFANPSIGDTIRRLCLDGSNRQPKFILPTASDRVAKGKSVTGLALVSAFWCRYCYGTSDSGSIIEPNDPSWDRLTKQAALAKAIRRHGSRWMISLVRLLQIQLMWRLFHPRFCASGRMGLSKRSSVIWQVSHYN